MARTNLLPAAALGAALGLGVAGCGGAGGGAPADGDWSGQTLDVWIMQGTHSDATAFFDAVGESFAARTGAELNVEFIPWADAHDKFVTAIAGQTTPDVAELGTTFTLEFAGTGVLHDLSPLVGDPGDYAEALTLAGSVDGGLYGVPWYAGVRSIVYRTDVFEDLGLEEPEDWEELRETARTIAAEREDMIAFPVPGDAPFSVLPFIWGAGGEIAVQEADGSWTSGLDSAEARDGLAFYTDLALEEGVSTTGAVNWNEVDVQDGITGGDVAMAVSGNWTPKAITDAEEGLAGRLGAFPIPGPEGGYSPSFLGGSHLGVFEGTGREALAWEFIELVTGPDFARTWTEDTTFFPGRQDAMDLYTGSEDPLVRPFAVQMDQASRGTPVTENYGRVEGEKVIQAMVQSVLNGRATVEEATARAARDVERILNEGS